MEHCASRNAAYQNRIPEAAHPKWCDDDGIAPNHLLPDGQARGDTPVATRWIDVVQELGAWAAAGGIRHRVPHVIPSRACAGSRMQQNEAAMTATLHRSQII